ncbi:MAG: glutaminyl-peptide cyclotransferase [Puia sp.]
MHKFFVPLFLIIVLVSACGDSSNSSSNSNAATETAAASEEPVISYTILNALPHDKDSYTEGFLMHDGKLLKVPAHQKGMTKQGQYLAL